MTPDEVKKHIDLNAELANIIKKATASITSCDPNECLARELVRAFPDSDLDIDLFGDVDFITSLSAEIRSWDSLSRNGSEELAYTLITHEGFERFTNDKQIARNILAVHGEYLEDFSEDIRDDKDIVLLAIKNHPASYIAASPRLQQDTDIVKLRSSKTGTPITPPSPS